MSHARNGEFYRAVTQRDRKLIACLALPPALYFLLRTQPEHGRICGYQPSRIQNSWLCIEPHYATVCKLGGYWRTATAGIRRDICFNSADRLGIELTWS